MVSVTDAAGEMYITNGTAVIVGVYNVSVYHQPDFFLRLE